MTRMSGVNGTDDPQGSADAIRRYIEANHGKFPVEADQLVEKLLIWEEPHSVIVK